MVTITSYRDGPETLKPGGTTWKLLKIQTTKLSTTESKAPKMLSNRFLLTEQILAKAIIGFFLN